MKSIFKNISRKFKMNGSFELNVSKKEFVKEFEENVTFEKINFFTPPIEKKNPNKYFGEVSEKNFVLKRIWDLDNIGFHFEVCKGEFFEKNNKLVIKYKINGLQGFSILLISIFSIIIIYFLSETLFQKGFNQHGANLIITPLILIFCYLFYRIIIKQMIRNVVELNENFELDVRDWFRV